VSFAAWTGLAAAGGCGAIARFLLDGAVSARSGRLLPYGTLAVNLTGAFVLGALGGADVGGDALRVAGTGFVGAYTTFSTWMLETHRLGEEGELRAAAANVGVPLALGLGAVALGRWAGGAL
jgi:fluoride exporter